MGSRVEFSAVVALAVNGIGAPRDKTGAVVVAVGVDGCVVCRCKFSRRCGAPFANESSGSIEVFALLAPNPLIALCIVGSGDDCATAAVTATEIDACICAAAAAEEVGALGPLARIL